MSLSVRLVYSEVWCKMKQLIAEDACWDFQANFPEEFLSYGCGPGGLGDWFVPDTMWGLSVTPACRIHDWDYRHSEGWGEEHRLECDQRLRDNCLIIVNGRSRSKVLRSLRRLRVKTYYYSVRLGGGKAYWSERD